MSSILTGRKKEIAILGKAYQSNRAELVAVIGRRRVGKTFLIKEIYKAKIDFELTGLQDAPLSEQLQNFSYQLTEFMGAKMPLKEPKNWLEAFRMLINYLKEKKGNRKQIVFLDELPWLATPKSGLLRGLSYFWNSWAVNQKVVVVICGSAASWMIQKVVNHKGGLHNRITKRIQLHPFSLLETEQYLKNKNITLNRYQLVQIYMAIGGIPHYLEEIETGMSAVQIIDTICFSETGLLRDEFSKLYPALFDNAEKHIAIIRALAQKRQGLSRNELIKKSKLTNGGSLTRILDELTQSGFIANYLSFNKKKKDTLYRLTDEYSLFYLQFIEKNLGDKKNVWQRLSQTQAYKTWSGYAYENICLKHIDQIKEALKIGGIYSTASSFYKKGTSEEKGTQIDLLIDRNDQIINLFEIKFYKEAMLLSKADATKLSDKLTIFQRATKTKKHLFLSLITTFGITPNSHSIGLIDQVLTLEDLFKA